MLRRYLIFLLVLLSLALSACVNLPKIQIPKVETPEFKLPQDMQYQQQPLPAWIDFGSSELRNLLNQLEKSNLAIAADQLAQRRAMLQINTQRANAMPNVKLSASERHNLDPTEGTSSGSHNASISLAYDFDFWGKIAATIRSAELQAMAATLRTADSRLRMYGQLTKLYLAILAQYEKIRLTKESLKATQSLLKLVKVRFDAGLDSGLDYQQQLNEVYSVQENLLRQQRDLQSDFLSLAELLGDTRLQQRPLAQIWQDLTIPQIAAVVPLELLKRRPDILLAEAGIRQAKQQQHIAKVDRYPSLAVAGDLRFSEILRGAESWLINLSLSAAQTLFDNGRKETALAIAELDVDDAELTYRQAVLRAFKEIADTLHNVAYAKDQLQLKQAELKNGKQIYAQALSRYKAGGIDYLRLLDAQKSWIRTQQSGVENELYYRQQLVDLVVASAGAELIGVKNE